MSLHLTESDFLGQATDVDTLIDLSGFWYVFLTPQKDHKKDLVIKGS